GLALSEVFGMEKVLLTLEGHGREDIGSEVDVSRTVGWFTTMYPVVLDMGYSGDSIRQLIAIKEGLHRVPNKGIGYGILRYLAGKDYRQSPEILFNYLGDFGSGVRSTQGDSLFEFSGSPRGREVSEDMGRTAVLEVTGMVVGGQIRLSIGYSGRQYAADSMEALLAAYHRHLSGLIDRLSAEENEHLSPVDLTYKELSVDRVTEIAEKYTLEDIYPLGPLQEGLYYHWTSEPNSPTHFEQMSYRLQGALDKKILAESYRELVKRHAVLRTFFTHELGERLLQVVRKEADCEFTCQDVSGDVHFSLAAYKEADRARGFDLHKGSQMRLTVLELGNDTYEFIWSSHHILMDGWCASILIRDYFHLYHSLLQGKAPVLNKVYPYSDYIKWLDTIDKKKTLQYWRDYLSDYDTIAALPKTGEHGQREYQRQSKSFRLEGSLRQAMRRVCGELGITESTFVQTVWGILLGRYNNTDDVVFGSVVSGRPADLEGIEEMIGLFINTIPVRVRVRRAAKISEVLKEIQQQSIEGDGYHYVQLAEVQAESELGRN
ncbi:MAG: condensation domain-containing protein, partial [Chitinophaga rupis]